MSQSQLTNFNLLLNSLKHASSQQEDLGPPDAAVLQALRDGMMPLADLVAKTKLSRDAIVAAVNVLLERRQVEILDQEERDGRKFIRLAPGATTGS